MTVRIKRIYEPVDPGDGYRVLIDRLWPRGVRKDQAHVDEWAHDLAPSGELRRWFGHDPSRFEEFARRYRTELDAQRDAIQALGVRARRETVTIVFAARDVTHSNATVVAALLREDDAD